MKVKVTVLDGTRIVKRVKIGRMEFILKMVTHLVPKVALICDLIEALNRGDTISYDTKTYTIQAKQCAINPPTEHQ